MTKEEEEVFRREIALEKEKILGEMRAERDEELKKLPDESLLWSALVPEWTPALARVCSFPTEINIEATFDQIQNAELFQTSAVSASIRSQIEPDSRLDFRSFWMPDDKRAEVLQHAVQNYGQSYLTEQAHTIGERILGARDNGLPIGERVARWAELALRAVDDWRLIERLDELADELLSGENPRPGELLKWLEAARPLEKWIGNKLTDALKRISRRLELHYRVTDDRRRLNKFLKRDSQVDAFLDLIKQSNPYWALHYIGRGGAGKTMLIRYLTAVVAPAKQIVTARVDFDLLNPDYPARAPGLLLENIAEELQVYARNESSAELFGLFLEKTNSLHDRLSGGAERSLDEAMLPVYDSLDLFVEAVRRLERQTVIILDTCEELAKIRFDGTTPPSVEATFRILEALHDRIENLRVVFSGRRPLAKAGAGWIAPESPLPARPYLAAHEIHSFTAGEAREYLTEIEKIAEEKIDSILKPALKEAEKDLLVWEQPAVEEIRYNPFDLSLYANWVAEGFGLTDTDRYIEFRIVARLQNPALRSLLPAVAVAGRFTDEMLRAAAGFADDNSVFRDVFQELARQEWVGRLSANELEIEKGLQPRLIAYFDRAQSSEISAARRRMTEFLERRTIEKIDAFDAFYFGLTLRLLAREPLRALRWWRQVESKFAENRDYYDLQRICENVLGEESETELDADEKDKEKLLPLILRAALYASYAATLTHSWNSSKVGEAWARASVFAEKHPVLEEANIILQCARNGVLAAARYGNRKLNQADVQHFGEDLLSFKPEKCDKQLVGSFVAAAESLLELWEENLPVQFEPETVEFFAETLDKTGAFEYEACFVKCLCGRLRALAGNPEKAFMYFQSAIKAASEAKTNSRNQIWLDWIAPDDLSARIRLEAIVHLYPAFRPSQVLALVRAETTNDETKTVDFNRLASAILQLRLAETAHILEGRGGLQFRLEFAKDFDQPVCLAHRKYLSSSVMLARYRAAGGKVKQAIDSLQNRSIASESLWNEFETVKDSDRELLRIVRRMRLRDENFSLSTSLENSNKLPDIEILSAIEGLSSPKQNPFSKDYTVSLPNLDNEADRLSLVHILFRSTFAITVNAGQDLVTLLSPIVTGGHPDAIATFAQMSCFLDCLEVNEIYASTGLSKPFVQFQFEQVKRTKVWHDKNAGAFEKLTLQLRYLALAPDIDLREIDKNLIERVGTRRTAEIALDEGELLALRLPERAVRLLTLAGVWFKEAGDFLGATIAQTCAAIASARINRKNDFSFFIRNIRENYAEKSLAEFGMFEWSHLLRMVETHTFAVFDYTDDVSWRPWMIRLLACLAWQRDDFRRGEYTNSFLQSLEKNYGKTSLPSEFEGWLNAENTANGQNLKSAAIDTEPVLSIVSASRASDLTILPNELTVNLTLESGEQSRSGVYTILGLAPYRDAALELLAKIREFEKIFNLELGSQLIAEATSRNVLKVKVDQQTGWVCWEALFELLRAEIINHTQIKDATTALHFWRTARDAPTRPVDWRQDLSKVLILTENFNARELVLNVWRKSNGVECQAVDKNFLLSGEHKEIFARILHVVGTPVETSAGVRLDLSAGARRARQVTKSSAQSSRREPLDESGGRGDLVKSDVLFSLLPKMTVCILQAKPRSGDDVRQRTRADREEAARLRWIATELARLGVPFVFTIPTLPERLAASVLNRILLCFSDLLSAPEEVSFDWQEAFPALSVSENRWDTRLAAHLFLRSIYTAREIVKNDKWASESDCLETAFDLCLYAADV